MKQLVFVATGLFLAFVLVVGAATHLVSRDEDKARRTESTEKRARVSKADLARHASSSDCWLAIRGKVYDVTRYIDEHPAPRATILRTCGTDATDAFATKGGLGRPHSTQAETLLRAMVVGEYTP
jgi:cytochrome b involved in lipid metabolism